MQDPLELKTRRRIFLFIEKDPGINEGEIVRLSGLNRGTVRYELDYLEKHEIITSSQEEKFRHYFPSGRIPSAHRVVLKKIMRGIPRALVVYLLLRPGSEFRQIAGEFDLAPSTISYHLTKLVDAGIVLRKRIGKQAFFDLKDPETVSLVLVTFHESYLADLKDRWEMRKEMGRGQVGRSKDLMISIGLF